MSELLSPAYLRGKRRHLRRIRRRELWERLAQPAIVAGFISALISLSCWLVVLIGGGR